MAAITISRQLGSHGNAIAFAVAARLQYRVVWREVINQAAHQAGAPEMALAEIDELGLLDIAPPPAVQEAYHAAMRRVMTDLANRGDVVIVGRAGQVLLGGRPDVLHVKILAPLDVRVRRVASEHAISEEAARARIEASDRHRSDYLWRCFGARWDDPCLYDLTVNTARLDVPAAVELIVCALKRIGAPPASS